MSIVRRHMWWSAGLLAVAAGWLVLNFPQHSLWYDEALTTWIARDSWATIWTWCTTVDIQVPLHYAALRLWTGVAGDSEFALRLLSALCILLAVAGLIAAGKRLTRQTSGGYAAGALLAFMPGLLWIAYEVRAYALGLALYAWATAFLAILIARSPTAPRLIPDRIVLGYALLMLGTLYTHYTGVGGFAAHLAALALLALFRRSAYLFRLLITVAVLVGIGFAPWVPVMVTRSGADRSYYTGDPIQPVRAAATMLGFHLMGREDAPDAYPWLVAGFATLIAAGALIGLIGLAGRGGRQATLVAMLIVLLPVAITAITVYFRPKLAGRYAWTAWIGADLLLALVVLACARWRKPLGVLALAALIAIPTFSGERGHPPRSDFRGAFAFICEHSTPQDVIVLRDGTLFVMANYYGRRAPCDVPRYTVPLPMALITDVQLALTYPLARDAARDIAARRPPSVWIVAWQGDVLDPQGFAYAFWDGAAAHTVQGALFGDVRLDRYEQPRFEDRFTLSSTPQSFVPDGPLLHGVRLFAAPSVKVGDVVVVQTWWTRGEQLAPELRVSAQLTSADGGWTYAQVDQPPAGWKYVDDRWQPGEIALGRYELTVGSDVPAGKAALRLVIYHAQNGWEPIILRVGTITVVQVTP